MIPALALRGIEKRFGSTRILRGVDLAIEPGERHALIGPNGAGKSTLFNLIAGGARPSAGRIHLFGADITRLAPAAIARRGLARSFQSTSVFARLSVFDNLRCAALLAERDRTRWWQRLTGSSAIDARAAEVLDAVGLGSRRDAMAGALSYAEQRALDLGIALAGGAHTLLLDEPTAGMNRAEAARAIELIRETTAGRTLLMVEHDMDAVFAIADRISVLVQGRIIASGSPAAIRADAAVRAAYLGEHVGAGIDARAGERTHGGMGGGAGEQAFGQADEEAGGQANNEARNRPGKDAADDEAKDGAPRPPAGKEGKAGKAGKAGQGDPQ